MQEREGEHLVRPDHPQEIYTVIQRILHGHAKIRNFLSYKIFFHARSEISYLQRCEHFNVISMCLYYSADLGVFFLFVLFIYLFIYLSITLIVFYYPCRVNFFGKSRLKDRKENCAIMTSFPWFKLSWTITFDQSASEKSLSYCQNKKKISNR